MRVCMSKAYRQWRVRQVYDLSRGQAVELIRRGMAQPVENEPALVPPEPPQAERAVVAPEEQRSVFSSSDDTTSKPRRKSKPRKRVSEDYVDG